MSQVHDALVALRLSVAQFDSHEKMALATFLCGNCNPVFDLSISEKDQPFSEALQNAIKASTEFSVITKLGFAIELLQFCQDEEEEAGCWDGGEEIDLDPYGYLTPALDEEEDF